MPGQIYGKFHGMITVEEALKTMRPIWEKAERDAARSRAEEEERQRMAFEPSPEPRDHLPDDDDPLDW